LIARETVSGDAHTEDSNLEETGCNFDHRLIGPHSPEVPVPVVP
jgi:hypothetical protein